MSFAEIMIAVCLVSIGIIAGHEFGEKSTRDKAIKAGVAEYYLDDNHNKQFRWIPKTEEVGR